MFHSSCYHDTKRDFDMSSTICTIIIGLLDRDVAIKAIHLF